jgi:20S proteasome alpha/beta subunit
MIIHLTKVRGAPMIAHKPRVQPDHERLPRRKAVTIVLGLKSPQGVVLAADTQETYVGSHKVNRPKLAYHSGDNLCGLPVGMAIAGAGFGPSLDKLSSTMWESVLDASGIDEACTKAEEAIAGHYRHYREVMQLENDELVYGIGASASTRLFHAWGPIVNEISHQASGSGQPIADFLLRNFKDTMHITNAMAWAVYILYCAKQHADGCGGNSNVAVLQNDGQNYHLAPDHIEALEKLFYEASGVTDLLLMAAGNPVLDAKGVKMAGEVMSRMIANQAAQLTSVKSMPDLLARLRQGVTPSVSQKSAQVP